MDHVTVASSLQWAFNIVSLGTIGTVLATMIKGKSDLKITIKQLDAAQKIADQTGGRAEDAQLALDRKEVNEERKQQYKDVCENRDYWRGEALRYQGLLEGRDKGWTELGTTYSEAYSIVTMVKERIGQGDPIRLLTHQDP